MVLVSVIYLITLLFFSINRWREMLNEDYLRELKHQMTVKYQKKEVRLNPSTDILQRYRISQGHSNHNNTARFITSKFRFEC